MNFLSPDDIFSGVRRKSLCNEALLQLSGKQNAESAGLTASSKSKKDRRRGSFNETTISSSPKEGGGRRSSLVSRWFKHISDAAEQYKPRSKNANHEPVDDPAIATLPHSNTRESLELTPDRPAPLSATANVLTTPLAPMIPISAVSSEKNTFCEGGREVTLTSAGPSSDSYPPYYNIKQRLSHNELSANNSGVNRTMSTRSCGNTNHNYSNTADFPGANGVTLRHTQSARQANGSGEVNSFGVVGNKRDSASIVCSNNSNNTRTLMQSSPKLVEPTAIHISISPAHTAEPVLTSAEKLRRLDASIRNGLIEKQKIICDMFRLPVENFNEIVDIAAMPEAPKDSTDIALAAYAQVQSLTEVMNEYMNVTPEQEISAVSTAVCDKCHEKQVQNLQRESWLEKLGNSDVAPPLPPPNKQVAQAQQQTPASVVIKMQTCAVEEANIHEDDDGYCEIDELRLPALPILTKTATAARAILLTTPITKPVEPKAGSPPPPLPPPAGTFKTPPPPPPPPMKTANSPAASSSNIITTTPDLVKRQSTISADSIPEESADDLTKALNDRTDCGEVDTQPQETQKVQEANLNASSEKNAREETHILKLFEVGSSVKASEGVESSAPIATIDGDEGKDDDSAAHRTECESATTIRNPKSYTDATESTDVEDSPTSSMIAEAQRQNSNITNTDDTSLDVEHTEINEAYECLSSLHKLNTALSVMVDNSTQTLPVPTPLPVSSNTTPNPTKTSSDNRVYLPAPCGPNRIQHANFLEPSVPCYALSSIVSTLNSQISLLLPKINERDMERERLRKENLHLRELLNAMHERHRVESELETPSGITKSEDTAEDEIVDLSPTTNTTAATTEAQQLGN